MKPPPISSPRGFSLVEVTIAMAIAAIGILSVIGLIPQGMETMREATDQAVEGRIHQQILSELQMADFDALDTVYNSASGPLQFYYDDQGEEIGDSGSGALRDGSVHVYTARVTVPKSTGGSLPQSVGGASYAGFSFEGPGGPANAYARPVVVEVAAVGNKGTEFKFDEEDNRRMISTYQSTLVKLGQDFTAAPATP